MVYFLFIEGILYALFPSKMKSMLKKLDLLKDNQLRLGGLIFLILGFIIIYYFKSTYMKKLKIYFLSLLIILSLNSNSFSNMS